MSANELFLTDRLKSSVFSPRSRQNDVTSRGGKSQVIEQGPTYWVASFRYENLQPLQWRALTAWLGRRNGAASPFTAYQSSRKNPLEYPSGGSNTGLVLSGYNSTTGAITLNKGNMSVGDHVSWTDVNGGLFLGEIVEVTSVSGSSTTFKTYPFAAQPHASPVPKVFGAVASFRLIPGSVRPEDRADKIYGLSFEARQKED